MSNSDHFDRSPKMNDVTFGKSTPIPMSNDSSAETAVFLNGDDVATIRKETANVATGAARDWYPKYAACSYDVEFFIADYQEDKSFDVDDYASAREALTAAKEYARAALLNLEVA